MGTKERKWQGELERAQASGLSLAEYAARHGINVRRLYETRHARARAKAAQARKASAFVRVKLKAASPTVVTEFHEPRAVGVLTMQARLPNGVILSWRQDASGAPVLVELMHTLAGLPCSA